MPGYNEIILEVEGKKYTSDNVKFKYYQTQSVKTILGKFGEDGWTSSDDSKIEEFRMNECTGIVALQDKKVIISFSLEEDGATVPILCH